jgi:hypothetical protein
MAKERFETGPWIYISTPIELGHLKTSTVTGQASEENCIHVRLFTVRLGFRNLFFFFAVLFFGGRVLNNVG